MKHEKSLAFFTAGMLAFLTAWGTVGCLTTAFGLNLEYPAVPVLACGLGAIASAALFSFRHGGTVLLCLLSLGAGYLYQDGTAAEQFLQLIHRLSVIYDRAYGWGILELSELPWDAGFSDWPLGITGAIITMTVTRTVICQKSLRAPVLAVLLPLCSCIVVTDTVPGEIWLLMVMTGLALLILTDTVRRENASQGLRLLLAAALPVVLALGGLFLWFPQKDYVNRSAVLRENILIAAENIPRFMETGIHQIASGLQAQPARQVDLAELGSRIPFTYPVMEVTSRRSGTLYLRQQDYDLYDGLGWTASEGRQEVFPTVTGPEDSIVIRTENRKNSLFLPYYPASVTSLENGYVKNSDAAREYTIVCNTLPENWRQAAYRNAAEPEEAWEGYLSLPEKTRQGAERYLDQLYPKENTSNTEKAELIAAMVLSSARYDLDSRKMPPSEPDFALWFLEEADRGYCVHFATAATVLLRTAGVPARYVTGYMLETTAGEAVTVTEENAHAWAEYYEPNLGVWLPLEATPGDEAPIYPLSPQTTPPETAAPTESAPEATQPSAEASSESTRPPETTLPEIPQTDREEPSGPAVRGPFPIVLLLPPILLILPLQRSVRLALRRRRQNRGDANRKALQRWREAERLARLLKESPTEELMVLAQKAKFSQYQLTQEELSRFDSFHRTCLRKLRKKPWYLQLVYRFIYAAY